MKAAILEQIGKPLGIQEIDLFNEDRSMMELRPGHVFVRVLTAGICGAQLQEIDGIKGNPSHCPHLLGHEGCGIVTAVGMGVTTVMPGDKVVIHWRKGEGLDPEPQTFGKIKAGPCTTFSDTTVVSENRVTRIWNHAPNDLACLIGCCLSTALATVENVARLRPLRDSVLVIGAGGVGLAMILAARMRDTHVTAIDGFDSKQALAESLGATFHRSNEFYDLKVRGYDVIIDTTGNPEIFSTFIQYLASSGKYILIGQPKTGIPFTIPNANALFRGEGQTIQATQAGGFNPTVDIPRYVQLWRDGKLDDYKKLITHRIKLADINEGIALMRRGQTGRVLIEFP